MGSKLCLTKLHKDILKMAKLMLEPFKGNCWIESAGKHHRLFIEINNIKRFSPLSKTPSLSEFAMVHKRNDIKKLIKELTNV
jgi:preprotein translocase subunit Sss1